MSTYKPNWTVALVVVNEFAQQQAAAIKDRNASKQFSALAKECENAYNRGLSPREMSQDSYDAILRMYWIANERQPELINRTIRALQA